MRRYILYFDIYLEYLDDNDQEKRGLCGGRNSVRPRETINMKSVSILIFIETIMVRKRGDYVVEEILCDQ